MDISFELYKIFYHAANFESFSEAADKLYITQSAVSQSIKNLEEKIGSQLFFRKARKVKLTQDGELLFKHVEQAYNFIKIAESKIVEMQNLNSGEIRIGVSDTICKYFLIPYLEKFNSLYPKIKLRVINRTSSQLLRILKNGLIDLGIVTLPIDDNSITVSKFISVKDIFVACNKYAALKGRKVALNELAENSMMMLERNSATRLVIDSFLLNKGIKITPEIELESVDLLVEFAKIGLGISHVLKESAAAAIESGDLFEVEIEEELPTRELGIITMQNVPLSHASREFIKFLQGGGI